MLRKKKNIIKSKAAENTADGDKNDDKVQDGGRDNIEQIWQGRNFSNNNNSSGLKNEEFVSTVDGRRRGIYMGRKQQPQQQQQSNQDRFQRSQQRWNQQEDRRGRGERRWRVNKRPDSPDVWRHDKFEELKEQDQEEEEEEEVQFQEGTVELEY
eukprot:TRINITY_DN12414_c0_g2_i9.p4 TRINITY_DN12414_c0_g2~~TRINITY_DN12414_c0_g2_i9.p4  ORF type:complete len:154 (-),score=42.72 TRINITY_DN12414_c0_g2_i9:166-627(-)